VPQPDCLRRGDREPGRCCHLDVLVGPAGTGKTTAFRALHPAWTAAYGKNSVIGLAPLAAAADVLGHKYGVRTDSTVKYLREYTHGRWNRDSSSWLMRHPWPGRSPWTGSPATPQPWARKIGDHGQLSAIETCGAFGMFARTGQDVAELTDLRRFHTGWEKTASLGLRLGDPAVLAAHQEHGRVYDGDQDQMPDVAYRGRLADRGAGKQSVMIAAPPRRSPS
jgi:hypothetical protein